MKRGVIFLAGNVGTWKSTLSWALSKKIGAKHYDIDEIKKIIYPTDPDYQRNIEAGIPFSDVTRKKVFIKVLDDFQRLSKEYDIIIVEEVLHKKYLRDILFRGAKDFFWKYHIFLIESDESLVQTRLLSKRREGHILSNPLKVYTEIKKSFEPIEEAHTIILNNNSIESSITEILSYIN